jgi:hypothetical protein
MSEIASLLRLLVQADKEFKITPVTVLGSASKFTSALSSGYKRKAFAAYNNSASTSGEILWGGSDVATKGMPIPKGAIADLPVANTLDVYFANSVSGERGDLRVIELA